MCMNKGTGGGYVMVDIFGTLTLVIGSGLDKCVRLPALEKFHDSEQRKPWNMLLIAIIII